MDSPEDEDTSEVVRPSRWFRRVLPVTLLGLVVIALAALLSPAVRHQLDLSVRRQPSSYVELYFAQSASGAQAVCRRKASSVMVAFVIESHLGSRQTTAYRVLVDPSRKGLRSRTRAGSADVSPGKALVVNESFAVPRDEGYVVSVELPGLDQRLRAHCRGGR